MTNKMNKLIIGLVIGGTTLGGFTTGYNIDKEQIQEENKKVIVQYEIQKEETQEVIQETKEVLQETKEELKEVKEELKEEQIQKQEQIQTQTQEQPIKSQEYIEFYNKVKGVNPSLTDELISRQWRQLKNQ